MTASSGPFGSALGRRILTLLWVVLTLCSLLFLAIFVASLRNRQINEHADAATQVNTMLEAALKNAMLNRDLPGLRNMVVEIGKERNIGEIYILNPEGDIRFASDASREGTSFSALTGQEVNAQVLPSAVFTTGPDGGSIVRSVNPVNNEPRCQSCHGSVADHPVNGILVVDYAADDVVNDYRRIAIILAGAGLAVLLAALFTIMSAINRHILKPVAGIHAAANRFAAGDLSARATISGSDELSDLGQQFNDMAKRVGENVQAMKVNERFLQELIDAVPDGMRVIGPDYRILKVNAAYCRQLGETPETAIAKPCHLSSHASRVPCSPTLFTCPMVELAQGGKSSLKCRHRHIRQDGSEVFVEVSAARATLEQEGQSLDCIIESIRDLSNQSEATHGQRLAEIGQLAAGIAHEIHNPLWSIHLAIDAIRKDMASTDKPASADGYFDVASREISRCLDVTGRLLRVSEPSSQERVLLRIDTLLRDVGGLLSYQAKQTGVTLDIEVSGTPRVIANESDLGIVILNLAQNAIHAMPRGGRLTIVAAAADGNVTMTFADEGVGIAPEDIARIFWPFWSKRADGSSGTGLGLSICRATVERMKGDLTVTSIVAKGSTFRVVLPDADFSGESS